jgi:peptidoglycan/LPS O-acetylase OafA/YrhL
MKAQVMKLERRRNIQLDVLRGLAILLVFGRHVEIPRPGGVVGAFAELWYRIGWIGVDLFFVLSGFLIGGLLVTELQKHGRIDVTRFLVRRGLKLYPGYFVFIAYLMFMPAAKALAHGDDAGASLAEMWRQCWPNLLFVQNYLWTPAGHTWSLAVEEHFYLLLPFAMAALAASGRVRWLALICLAAVPVFLAMRGLAVWSGDRFAETMSATHLRFDALLFGVGIRAVAQYFPERFQGLRRWRGVLVAAGVLLWLPNCFIDPGTALIRTVGLTGTFLGSAAFLIAAYHTHAADFGRSKRFVLFLASVVASVGVYSYGIYLWHVTAFGIVGREAGGRLMTWTGGPTQPAWLASVFLMCAGAIAVGVVASVVVEWPVLRLRDRFFPSRATALFVDSAISGDDRSAPSRPGVDTVCTSLTPAKLPEC